MFQFDAELSCFVGMLKHIRKERKKEMHYTAGGEQVRPLGKGVRTAASGCLIDPSEGKVQQHRQALIKTRCKTG